MNLFWASLSKKKKIQVLILGIIGIVFVVGVILLLVRLFAQDVCPPGHICNEATVTWTDSSGSHSATSNMTDTTITTSSVSTTITYSLQNVTGTTPDHSCAFTLKVFNPGTTTQVGTTQNLSGNSAGSATTTIGIATGTYDFVMKCDGYLSKKYPSFAYTSSTSQTIAFGKLFTGDINSNDDAINALDYTQWILDLKNNAPGTGWQTCSCKSDVNRDGDINGFDYAIVIKNMSITTIPVVVGHDPY